MVGSNSASDARLLIRDVTAVAQIEAYIGHRWVLADSDEAAALAVLMSQTASPSWMASYLTPAAKGSIRHAPVLMAHYDPIAEAWATGQSDLEERR